MFMNCFKNHHLSGPIMGDGLSLEHACLVEILRYLPVCHGNIKHSVEFLLLFLFNTLLPKPAVHRHISYCTCFSVTQLLLNKIVGD